MQKGFSCYLNISRWLCDQDWVGALFATVAAICWAFALLARRLAFAVLASVNVSFLSIPAALLVDKAAGNDLFPDRKHPCNNNKNFSPFLMPCLSNAVKWNQNE
jgi:hypothetical protein